MSDCWGESVLLVSSIRWPLTAKLALAFLRHGCKVEVVCPQDHPFSYVRGISRTYLYRGLDSIESLAEAMTASNPGLVIPCDDGVVWQMHKLHESRPELRPLIERSLGAPAGYATVAGRAELMEIAEELGVRTPRTKRVSRSADLEEWFSTSKPAGVLKLDWTCGGKGVKFVHTQAEAESAMVALRRPATAMTALGRWLLIHDALAWWKWRNSEKGSLTLQQFIAGRPANTMLACREGKVLAMVSVEVLYAQSPTGTALAVRLLENDEMRVAGERIAQRLNLSGFHGLDFVLEDATGRAYLIELNPRCTQLGHLQIPGQGDLVGALCKAYGSRHPVCQERGIQEETIAFFPEALFSNPMCPYLSTSFIDAPWEEPELVIELMRRDWRDRELLARMYRTMKPPKGTAVGFETMVASQL